jgi:hypothetical protein
MSNTGSGGFVTGLLVGLAAGYGLAVYLTTGSLDALLSPSSAAAGKGKAGAGAKKGVCANVLRVHTAIWLRTRRNACRETL